RPAVPGSIRALFDRRFTTLSDRAMAMMQQTAIFGSRVNYAVLNAAAGLPPLEFDGVLHELTRAGILIQADALLSFRHDLIREVAAAQMPAAMSSALHLRAARALVRTKGSPGEIALHLSEAGDTRRAFDYALRGADAAERVYALEEAADLLELAIQHAPDESTQAELVGRLGKLYLHMRAYGRARPLLERRLEHVYQSNVSEVEKFEARRDLLFLDIYSSARNVEESGRALEALHAELAESGQDAPRLEAEILNKLLWAAICSFNPHLVENTIGIITELHNRNNQAHVKCRTARGLGIYEGYRRRPQEAETLLREALSQAKEAGDEAAVVDSYCGLTTLLPRVMRAELAEEILRVALPLAQQHANPELIATLFCNCAVYHMYLGDSERAEQLFDRAEQALQRCSHFRETVAYGLGFIAYLRGDDESAGECWTRALHASERDGVSSVRLECVAALGILAARGGQMSKARSLAAQALRLARRGGFLVEQRFGLEELLARLRYHAGHGDKALRQLARAAASARDCDIPLYLTAQLTRLELLLREGRRQEASDVRQELCQVAQSHGASWWIQQAEGLCSQARLQV
ncbi:MAG: hypothetical protein JSV41_02795, partial [Gemmatimonadota bacterium]